ncbi:hypothetical protein DGMP_26300 [Desulfomarina profundi]|uniref:Uncharacterized protein n=1 Tax=Desulfomarina profundi TaxID=2772557 RepID=A0A8D5FXT0_9BACT|nr:hypothetical protein DGMP_26300 [Desulfomarina profundi]
MSREINALGPLTGGVKSVEEIDLAHEFFLLADGNVCKWTIVQENHRKKEVFVRKNRWRPKAAICFF